MTKEFDHYRRVIRKALFKGTIKLYDPQDPNYEISDFQLLLTFAMGEIGKRKGYPCDATLEEIYYEMMKHAPEICLAGEENK